MRGGDRAKKFEWGMFTLKQGRKRDKGFVK